MVFVIGKVGLPELFAVETEPLVAAKRVDPELECLVK